MSAEISSEMKKFKRAYHELGNIAFKLKQYNHDLLIRLNSYTNGINWMLYVNGWTDAGECFSGIFYGDGADGDVEKGMKQLKKQLKGLFNEI